MIENVFNTVNWGSFKMPIIVIYNKPLDFPNQFVARLFDLNKPTACYVAKDTYEEVRESIPAHMIRCSRDESDDPRIVESWL